MGQTNVKSLDDEKQVRMINASYLDVHWVKEKYNPNTVKVNTHRPAQSELTYHCPRYSCKLTFMNKPSATASAVNVGAGRWTSAGISTSV